MPNKNASFLRPYYHLTAATGRINDPNGVYIEGNLLHCYFQTDPMWPLATKRTGWGHAYTKLEAAKPEAWVHLPDALAPTVDYDDRGCYSGSAVLVDGELELFYTGNSKPGGNRRATQNLVHVSDRLTEDSVSFNQTGGSHRRSSLNPLIDGPAEGYTNHYRDPQITLRDGVWTMILGAQRVDETGAAVLYTSTDRRTWNFKGEITFDLTNAQPGGAPDLIPGGYMWECPNLVTLHDEVRGEDLDILIFLPQGLEPQGFHYANNHQCGYVVGKLEGTTFHVLRGFTELDHGFEFYAPQVAFNNSNPAIPPVMIGWLGLPDQDDQPSKDEHWMHTLTLIRELSLKDLHLYQYPRAVLPTAPELGVHDAEFEMTPGSAVNLLDANGKTAMTVSLDEERVLKLDRSGQNYHTDVDFRAVKLPETHKPTVHVVRIIVDASTVEVYVNGGSIAAASRIYPDTAIIALEVQDK
ncbi:MAG: glycoside hydrolase family 32 protein [Corynebacterium sp.]|nr:glycoside hydrolase family 32 protein [Corynebacterium sp.]